MRILRLRGRNLASIEEFDLDFSAEPLRGASLTAICGPTGAGKSTLLDALCLPLYNRTARLSNARGGGRKDDDEPGINDPRAILRRGCVEAWSEVEFLGIDRRAYRATWRVQRARIRADGKLQEEKLSLLDVATGTMLATQKTEVLARIEELIGLSYAQFTRSVLLAQGEFSAFLKADAGERAHLLERMTRTRVFARISQLAYQRAMAEAAALHDLEVRLEESRTLSDEERAALAAETARIAQRRECLLAQVSELDAALEWHRGADRFDEATARARSAAEVARGAWEALAGDRDILARIQRAAPLRGPWFETRRAGRELERAIQEFGGLKAAAEQAEDQRGQAEFRVLDAAKLLDALGEQGERLRAELAGARALDADLRELSGGLRRSDEVLATARESFEKAGKAIEEVGRESAQVAESLSKAEAYFDEHLAEEAIAPAWGGLRLRLLELIRVRATTEAGDRQNADLDARQAEGERALLAFRAHVHGLAAQEADLAQRLPGLEAQARAAEASWKQADDGFRLAREEAEAARRSGEAASRASHGESAALRAALRAGEACPVCGSLDHPFVDAGQLDGFLRDLRALVDAAERREKLARVAEQEMREASRSAAESLADARAGRDGLLARIAAGRTEIEAMERGLSSGREEAARHAATREAAAARLSEIRQELDAGLAGRPEWIAALDADCGELLARLDRELDLLARARLRQAELEQSARRLEERASERRLALSAAREALDVAAAQASATRIRHDEVLDRRQKLLGGRPADAAEAQWHHEREAAGQALRAAEDACSRARQACAAARTALRVAEEALERARLDANAAAAALEQALGKAGLEQAEVEEALQHPETLADELRGRLDAAREALERAAGAVEAAEGERAVHEAGRPAGERGLQEESRTGFIAELEICGRRLGEIEADLRADDEARERRAKRGSEIHARRQAARRWDDLNALLGSASGDKFRRFAQGLTLDVLLAQANRHLASLRPRYRLERMAGSDLEFLVRDLELGGDTRPATTLSGGEAFLVSLALALGLSSLAAGAAAIETLFVDEGFGTLDPESLQAALAALDALQSSGRQVVVISHVPQLSEHAAALVRLEPVAPGRSRVVVGRGGGW